MSFNKPGDPIPFKFKWRELYFIGDQGNNKPNQPYILDLVTLERLYFQTIPIEGISVKPDAAWATVASPGRNIPLYQYTGGEDIINFSLSWYADQELRTDVISKCKWLQALSRNNGYNEKPHHVQLVFGSLFKASKWIVYSAPFSLKNFDRNNGMLPCLATQDIELRKISETNLKLDHYRKIDT